MIAVLKIYMDESGVHDGGIVLMHDFQHATAEAGPLSQDLPGGEIGYEEERNVKVAHFATLRAGGVGG